MRSAPGLLGLLSYLARPASDFQSRDISRRTRTTPPSRGRVRRKDVFSPARATQSEAQRCRYSDISPSKTRHGGILRAWNRPEPPMGSLMTPRAAQNTLCGGGNPRAIQLYKMTRIRNQKNTKQTRTLTEFELCHVHTCHVHVHVCIYCAIRRHGRLHFSSAVQRRATRRTSRLALSATPADHKRRSWAEMAGRDGGCGDSGRRHGHGYGHGHGNGHGYGYG